MPDFRFWKPRALDETTAWFCLVTNLTVLPGLGSLMAHRRVGYAQALLSLTGTGMSLLFIFRWVLSWLEQGSLPQVELGPDLLMGLGGIVVFGVSWLWGLLTGLAIVRQVGRSS